MSEEEEEKKKKNENETIKKTKEVRKTPGIIMIELLKILNFDASDLKKQQLGPGNQNFTFFFCGGFEDTREVYSNFWFWVLTHFPHFPHFLLFLDAISPVISWKHPFVALF